MRELINKNGRYYIISKNKEGIIKYIVSAGCKIKYLPEDCPVTSSYIAPFLVVSIDTEKVTVIVSFTDGSFANSTEEIPLNEFLRNEDYVFMQYYSISVKDNKIGIVTPSEERYVVDFQGIEKLNIEKHDEGKSYVIAQVDLPINDLIIQIVGNMDEKCENCKWFTWACPKWMCMDPKHPEYEKDSDYPVFVNGNDTCELIEHLN